jgi:radical SAM superfamily enzyme YgiQ (UPF0313 family)
VSEPSGRPAVVLVADRTLAADYRVLFEGMFATMQMTQVPRLAMRRLICPPVRTDAAGRAHTVPLGLRRIEASLVETLGLKGEDVVCTTPEALPRLLGPWTKVVGVTSGDPLGRGMSNTTTAHFWKGELYSRFWTLGMMEAIRRAKEAWGFKVLFGGGGAWQWADDPEQTRRSGVDTVFEGYFESAGPALIAGLLDGGEAAPNVRADGTAGEGIRPIRGGSLLGSVELSRGCGRGCRFCTMAHRKMYHLPPEIILADLETNVAEGITSVCSCSEDLFRYGAKGIRPDFQALRGLLAEMKRIRQLSFMQIDHANISSVAQLGDDELAEIRRLLTWRKRNDYLWVNMGVESANGRLVQRLAPGKLAPFRAEDWEEIVRESAGKMARANFFCVFSVILGMPEETPDDVVRTLRLVEEVTAGPAIVFPIFYEPLPHEVAAGARRFTLDAMTQEHLDLFAACYEVNFRKVPRLYWDNQRAGGVSWFKRMLIQMLGRTEVVTWRRTFRRTRRQIVARQAASAAPARRRASPAAGTALPKRPVAEEA